MATSIPTRSFAAGETVFRAGDDGDNAYLVESGGVGVFVPDGETEKLVARLLPGEIFGEMAIIDGRSRSATVRALEASRLTVISRRQIESRIHDTDPIIRMLIQVLMDRLRTSIGNASADDDDQRKEREDAIDRMRLAAELERALKDQQFEVHYQPIVNLEANRIAGFEALVRRRHPLHGMVQPDAFIDLAEQTSLIVPMGRWVMGQAMETLARLIRDNPGYPRLEMSINVSARQFADPGFVDAVSDCLSMSGVAADQIMLEITEGALIADDFAAARIDRCKALGCRIALDDFGTGYSSLNYLSRFPIDLLKIDRRFVAGMLLDRRSLAIVRSIMGLAEGLAIPTTAEGIEDEPQLNFLRALGCGFGQGFLFARPGPVADAEALLAAFRMPEGALG